MAETLVLTLCYLVGSLRFAYIIARLFGIASPDSFGSKNPGATNVARKNKVAGFLTFLLDCLKTIACYKIMITLGYSEDNAFLGMIATVIGHIFPPLGLGGKGVACWMGAMFVLSPLNALLCLITILTFGFGFNQLGIGSVLCVTVFSVICPEGMNLVNQIIWCATGSIIILLHRDNIKRLYTTLYAK
jgi:glycerol-3-phosphate acyltransferase PlsY|tara:strand:- start:11735 stop:12298 length:564 start_codon:yes stop_codon:yes gene_type:complete